MMCEMKGHSPSAHWINLINNDLMEKIGGFDHIRKTLPEAVELIRLNSGLLIKGAKKPPIGDVNRKAKDIGYLPDVARLLKPVRVHLSALGNKEIDGEEWLARFDDRESIPEVE